MAQLSLKVEIDEEKFQEMIEDFKRNNPDFIEVVRCKNCKHRGYINECGFVEYDCDSKCPLYCEDISYSQLKPDDWYCGMGERK